MKLHVFVATTQGLVAIQGITAIDDSDIRSIVSINGTSTTANISSAYHNFVRKGAGIIEQDFAKCSYRVNVSERIDHGNSWQLAFYLAHSANAQGFLGDGKVKVGDQVICATGEINTSNRSVQQVDQVALKQSLAAEQIQQWQLMGNDVCFLIPQDNQQDIALDLALKISAVSNLEQALSYLPILAASIGTAQPIAKAGDSIKLSGLLSLARLKIQHFSSKTLLWFTLILSAWLLAWMQFTSFTGADADNINAQQPSAIQQPSLSDQSQSQDNQQSTELTTNRLTGISMAQVSMKAYFAKYLDCQDETIEQSVSKSRDGFLASKLVNLCLLTLDAPASIQSVLLVAVDSRAIRLLSRQDKHWQIPLPKKQSTDRDYYLILMAHSSPQLVQSLQNYLYQTPRLGTLKYPEIEQWLNNNHWQALIVRHSLHSF
jgi:hypothetical protein